MVEQVAELVADTGAAPPPPAPDGAKPGADPVAAPAAAKPPTVIAGGAPALDEGDPAADAANWRDKLAGDDKAFRKKLERYTDESQFGKAVRELEKKAREKTTVASKPATDAAPEEVEAYRKAVGVPDKPEGYLDAIKLSDGRILGEADKPIFAEFAKMAHAQHLPQDVVSSVTEWYLDKQEAEAAAIAEQDRLFARDAQDALSEKWGADKKANINAIAPLFEAAGGGKIDDPDSLAARMLTGRTSDGRLFGNDPAVIEFLSGLARRFNDVEQLTDGSEPAKATDGRLAELAEMRTKDPDKYWSAPIQAEELALIAKQQARKSRS